MPKFSLAGDILLDFSSFLPFTLFVKFQNLLNDYVNKEMKQYLELEELNYYKSHYLLQRTSNDILFPAPVFNSEWLQLEDSAFQSWNGPECLTV